MYLIVEHRWIEIKDMSNVMISALGLAIANHRMRLWLIGYLFTIYKKSVQESFSLFCRYHNTDGKEYVKC